MLNLIEQRILDLLKFNPDSKEIYIKLGPHFSDEDIDHAFDSLVEKGVIKEKIRRVWDGRNVIYEGEIGHWEVVKC